MKSNRVFRFASYYFLALIVISVIIVAEEESTPSQHVSRLNSTDTTATQVLNNKDGRLRKRKRILRPQSSSSRSSNMNNTSTLDPVMAMVNDVANTTRRRIAPNFNQPHFDSTLEEVTSLRPIRKLDTMPALRVILKQQNGALSLSELLQQQNLSLSQLLQGGNNAISALLTAKTTPPTIVKTALDKRMYVLPSSTTTGMGRTPEMPSAVQSSIPSNAIKIHVNEMFALKNKQKRPLIVDEEQPLKMPLDLEQMTSTKNPTSMKMKPISAKEEILEVFRDPVSRAQLVKLLRIRNMTVQQLVAQRERGSSQVHLSDIFQRESQEAEHLPNDAIIYPGYLDIPVVVEKEKKSEDEKQQSPTTVTTVKETIKGSPVTVTSFPTYKIVADTTTTISATSRTTGNVKLKKKAKMLPPAGNSWLTDDDFTTETIRDVMNSLEREFQMMNPTNEENKLPTRNNENHMVDDDDDDDDDEEDDDGVFGLFFVNLPGGVKSAIIASVAIIGLSLLVFLTILCVFKMSQKRKLTLGYCNSFSGSRIKSPILQVGDLEVCPRDGGGVTTLRSLMWETWGRHNHKKYCKSNNSTTGGGNFWDTSSTLHDKHHPGNNYI